MHRRPGSGERGVFQETDSREAGEAPHFRRHMRLAGITHYMRAVGQRHPIQARTDEDPGQKQQRRSSSGTDHGARFGPDIR